MTTKHNLSNAAELFAGAGHHNAVFGVNKRNGVPVMPSFQLDLGAPVAADADGLAASQDGTGFSAGDTLTQAATALDLARNVTITSSADDSGITFTVTGTDHYGQAVVEVVTGANAGSAASTKTFKTVTSIAVSGASAGNVQAGWGDVLGLPYRLVGVCDVLSFYADDTEESAAATFAAGDATTATGTTNDVRGTVAPDTSPDGSVNFVLNLMLHGATAAQVGGVAQYAG